MGGVAFCCGAFFAAGLAMETFGLGLLIDIGLA